MTGDGNLLALVLRSILALPPLPLARSTLRQRPVTLIAPSAVLRGVYEGGGHTRLRLVVTAAIARLGYVFPRRARHAGISPSQSAAMEHAHSIDTTDASDNMQT